MEKDTAALVAAILALVGTVATAVMANRSARDLRLLEERLLHARDSRQFLSDKLTKLYLPASMYLSVTKPLFNRFFEDNTTEAEKTAIEHTLRDYNTRLRTLIVENVVYLEPDAPEAVTKDLLEHLLQWDTVYRLKYEFKVWPGPVFAGIKDFNFRGFPPGIDEYFHKTARELRERLHAANRQ